MNAPVTIATCLYDIRGREKESGLVVEENEESRKKQLRKLEEYMELGKSMLSIQLPMVIYTDSEEIEARLKDIRCEYGLEDQTVIVSLPFQDTFFYKDLDVLEERMKEYKIGNMNSTKDTPLYVMLNNNKFDFLERTIASNPFQSDFFVWLDLGVQHCAKATEEEWACVASEWPPLLTQNTTQIHQLCIHTVTKAPSQSWKDYFRVIYHHRGGGLFGGHRDMLLQYSKRFKDLWYKIVEEEKWWQLDEALMTIITEEHPEDFRFFYGDYDGMITNFTESRRSWELVFQTAQRHLDGRKYALSEHVLQSLDNVMKKLPGNDAQFLRYFRMRICNDYYKWNGWFSEPLRSILMDKTRVEEIPKSFLQHEMNNLRFYHEKGAMEFMMRWSLLEERNSIAMERWKHMNHTNESWISLNKDHETWTGLDLVLPIADEHLTEFHMVTNYFRDRLVTIQAQSLELDARVRKLFHYIELAEQPVVFTLFYRNEKKQEIYSYLKELCGYIERNYSSLDFHLLFLNATPHEISKKDQEECPRLLVFHLHLPYQYMTDDKQAARLEGLSHWRQEILQSTL